MHALRLHRATLDDILAHARAVHPDECCGAVVREGDVERVVRFTNVQDRLHAQDPTTYPRTAQTAYTPDPREQLAAERAAEKPGAGLAVLYHSHSVRGSYFSGEDQARALFDGEPIHPETAYLVVSDARTPGEARAFRWNPAANEYTEVPVEIV